jgi:hypothetical protein
MNARRFVTVLIISMLSSLTSANLAFGQTPMSATAHIPYDFWIGGTRLPAGDYSVSSGPASIVVFWNEKANIGEQAFLIPTGHVVASGDCKLIFVLRGTEHCLRAVWVSQGTGVLSSEFDVPFANDKEIEIKLLEQKHDAEIVQARH